MPGTLIGDAHCSTDAQDLTAQRDRLRDLGVTEERIYLEHGLTGTTRARPGLDQALAAVRAGDTPSCRNSTDSHDPSRMRARSVTAWPSAVSSYPAAAR